MLTWCAIGIDGGTADENQKFHVGGNSFEIYFEEDDFDKFAEKLKRYEVECVHPIKEHSWGSEWLGFMTPTSTLLRLEKNESSLQAVFG